MTTTTTYRTLAAELGVTPDEVLVYADQLVLIDGPRAVFPVDGGDELTDAAADAIRQQFATIQ